MSLPPLSSGANRAATIDLSSSRAAARFAALGCVLMAAMPVAMWAANRSAPLVLGLAAAAFLGAVLASGGARRAADDFAALARSPLALVLAGFLAWALLSLSWSHRPAIGFSMWGELALPLGFGFVIAMTGAFVATPPLRRALALLLIAAAALMAFEIETGLAQRIAMGIGKQMSFVFNRPVITCLVLAAPAIHLLWTSGARQALDRPLAGLAALVAAGIVLYSDSGAAKLGLMVLVLVWLLARLLPRLTLAAIALGFAATLVLAPFVGRITDSILPPALYEQTADSHSRERVDIWLSFGEAIAARPLLGSGFGSASALQTHPVAEQVSPPRRLLLAVGHPHSAPIQVWVETGLMGAGLLLAAGLMFLARLAPLSAGELAPRLGLFAAAFAMASVGHGAWQGWWIAILAAATLWFGAGRRAGEGKDHG
jgi:O-antigen ligase